MPRGLIAAAAGLLMLAAPGVAAPAGGTGFELREARVTPGEPLLFGEREITLHYGFAAERRVGVRIEVIRARSGNVVSVLREPRARPGRRLEQTWNGLTRRGAAAPDGRYEFRVGPAGERTRFAASFVLRGHAFPVDGPHGTRGAIGEFGAARNGGRVHEGFDVTGACGTPLVAARGGRVEKTGFDPVLYGYFVRIGGAKTRQDYFYSHLIAPAEVSEGSRVATGEAVGRIGQTGNAASTPCHLHFEIRVGRRADRPGARAAALGRRGLMVRTANREDAPLLARMLHDFNTEFGDPTPGPEVLSRRVEAYIEDGRKTFLLGGAEEGAERGFAQVSFNPSIWADEPVGLLEELYVVPDRRGEGVGRELMEALLALARERGAAGMEVITGESDTAARGLYESVGFRNDIEGEERSRSLFYELDL